MADIKHVGRIKSTNKKCIVAYRTLPGDAYNCLIIPTESLPESYHDSLINLVESNAGQAAYEFAEVLARSSFPDGSIMLAALHTQSKLVKVPTDQVEMLPRPAVSILLAELNQIIAEQMGIAVDELALKQPNSDKTKEIADTTQVIETPSVTPVDDVTRTTSASVNQSEDVIQTPAVALPPAEQAAQYRADVDRLLAEAANLTKLAEALEPDVAVVTGVKSAVKSVAKPATKQATKSTVSKATSKPATKPATKQATKQATKPKV